MRERLRSRLAGAAALAVLFLATLGCTGDDAPGDGVNATSPSSPSSSPVAEVLPTASATSEPPVAPSPSPSQAVVVTAAPDATAISEPVARRRVLFRHIDGELILDPLAQSALNTFPFAEVYAGLVRVGDDVSGDVQPDLAEAWRVSEDGLRYTFTLRDGLRFSDGTPLTSADFKWSWERALRPAYATSNASEVFGAVLGAADMLAGDALTLAGVAVVDDVTLQVDLVRPQSHFVHLLADPAASVLSEANFESWGTLNWVEYSRSKTVGHLDSFEFIELPVGAGPFRVAKYQEPILPCWSPIRIDGAEHQRSTRSTCCTKATRPP